MDSVDAEHVARGNVLQSSRSNTQEFAGLGNEKYTDPLSSWIEERKTNSINDAVKEVVTEPLVNRIDIQACGTWLANDRMVKLAQVCGKFFNHMGVETDIGRCLYPEEALYLLTVGELNIEFEGASLTVSSAMDLMTPSNDDYNRYLVYEHLANTGCKIVRHQAHLNFTKYEKSLRLDQHQEKRKKKITLLNGDSHNDNNNEGVQQIDEELDAFYASLGLDKDNDKQVAPDNEVMQDLVLSPLKEYDKKKKELLNMIPNYIGRETFHIPILDRDLYPDNCDPTRSVYELSKEKMNYFSIYEDSSTSGYQSSHINDYYNKNNYHKITRGYSRFNSNLKTNNSEMNCGNSSPNKNNFAYNSRSDHSSDGESPHKKPATVVEYARRDNRRFCTNGSFEASTGNNYNNKDYSHRSSHDDQVGKKISSFIEEIKNEHKFVYYDNTDRGESDSEKYCPFSAYSINDDCEMRESREGCNSAPISNRDSRVQPWNSDSNAPTWKRRRRKKQFEEKFPCYPSSLVKAIVKRVNNWQEYKDVLSKTNEDSLLKWGLGAKLWFGNTKPLVKPSLAINNDNIYEACSVINELDTQKCTYNGDHLKLHYDVYFPNNPYKKSRPTIPNARVSVNRDESIPSLGKILEAQTRFKDDVTVISAFILLGKVRLYSLTTLPIPLRPKL